MSRLLIIADLHGRKFWREAIANNIDKVDKVIFLGDYLDPYLEEIQTTPELMECNDFYDSQTLLKMLEDIASLKEEHPDKVILLTGNHTDSYIWSEFHAATRTDHKNWEKYHKFFSESLDLFNLVWIENNVIFSHAGISKGWANEFLYHYMKYDEGAELEKDSLVFETARVLKDTPLNDFNKYYINSLSCISSYRWGNAPNGSCEWADIMEHVDHYQSEVEEKLVPLGEDGIYQIFGHTQLQKPLITDKWSCLDCKKGFIFDTETYDCKSCF